MTSVSVTPAGCACGGLLPVPILRVLMICGRPSCPCQNSTRCVSIADAYLLLKQPRPANAWPTKGISAIDVGSCNSAELSKQQYLMAAQSNAFFEAYVKQGYSSTASKRPVMKFRSRLRFHSPTAVISMCKAQVSTQMQAHLQCRHLLKCWHV